MQTQIKAAQVPSSTLSSRGLLQHKCACGQHTVTGGECAECRQKSEGMIQRAAVIAIPIHGVPSIVHDVLSSAGRPLDEPTRSFMEPRFGHDFSHVKVHIDERAAESAQAVNALAYTVGNDVVFGEKQYAPMTTKGRWLLAHELTHVVQQQGSAISGSPILSEIVSEQGGQYEQEANTVADSVVSAFPVTVHNHVQGGPIQKVAPAVAAAGALLLKCLTGAVIGVLFDMLIQGAIYGWKKGTWRLWDVTVDYCSLLLSAILGCVGGVVGAKWLEPLIDKSLGTKLGGLGGPLVGKVLMFLVKKGTITISKGVLKKLMKLGCVSKEQAEAMSPGIVSEYVAELEGVDTTSDEREDQAIAMNTSPTEDVTTVAESSASVPGVDTGEMAA